MNSFSFSKGEKLEVSIESLASNGPGVAKHKGLVIFVPATCPGDIAEIELLKVKKNFAEAKLLTLKKESPQRRQPECQYNKECGGCSWLHISYEEQLKQKHKQVKDSLERIAGIPAPKFEIEPSPQEFRYRNRIQLHQIGRILGYHSNKSHKIIDIEDCLIADERLTGLFKNLKAENPQKKRRFEIRMENDLPVVISSERERGFVQANSAQNKNLVSAVSQAVQKFSPTTILELYCGSGNFSIPIAKSHTEIEILGADSNANSIESANSKAQTLGLKNAHFFAEDSRHFLEKYEEKENSLLLLDPTRDGCDRDLLQLATQKSLSEILYISCNPSTWARDVKFLMEQDSSWRLEQLKAFDMFPQTPHVELLSVLTRKNAPQ